MLRIGKQAISYCLFDIHILCVNETDSSSHTEKYIYIAHIDYIAHNAQELTPMAEKEPNTTAAHGGVKILRVVNFSHPLSEVAVEQLGHPEIENVRVQIDLDVPVAPQIVDIVDGVETRLDGTVAGLAIVLPGMSEATAYILAELHGRMGGFPNIVPLRRDDEMGVFVVAGEGMQSLDRVRRAARGRRA